MKTSKVHTKEELLSAIISNSDRIKSFGVNRLGIFGSAIKGSFTESSDVDLLVEFYPEKNHLTILLTCLFSWRIYWGELSK